MTNIAARRVFKHAIKNYNRTYCKYMPDYYTAWKKADEELFEFIKARGWTIEKTKINPLYCLVCILNTKIHNKTFNRLGRAAKKQNKLVDLNDLYIKSLFVPRDYRTVKFI